MKSELAPKPACAADYKSWQYDSLKDNVFDKIESLNQRLKAGGSKTRFSMIHDDEKRELELQYIAGEKGLLKKLFSRASTPVEPVRLVCISLGVDTYIFDQKDCDVGDGEQEYVRHAFLKDKISEYCETMISGTRDERILSAPALTSMEPRQP